MADELPDPVFDAFRAAAARGEMPTNLDTAGLRELAAELRARMVFTARGTSAVFVSKIKEVIDLLAAGDIGIADARVALIETLRALGYTPEGGFPAESPETRDQRQKEGSVPPAVKGTLQDLSSFRRLDLIVRTQLELMQGAGQQAAGLTADRLEAFPAWELIRVEEKEKPRFWGGSHTGSLPRTPKGIDPRSRWQIAGGKEIRDDARVTKWEEDMAVAEEQRDQEEKDFKGARDYSNPEWLAFERKWAAVWIRLGARPTPFVLIALKGDPVWGELGSSGNFNDALDVDHPPFAFNSGMGWREVQREETIALGITGPNGETVDEWIATNPRTMDGPLPRPRISMGGTDPELRDDFVKETGAVPVAGKPDLYELPPATEDEDDEPTMTLEERMTEAARRRDEELLKREAERGAA